MLVSLFLGTGACRFARSDAPEWIEAHGRGQLVAIAADFEGAIAVGGNRRIYRYPGGYGQPWQERFQQDAALIAAADGVVAWTGLDGVVRISDNGGAPREIPASGAWQASALALGPRGALYVVSQARAVPVVGDRLGEAICDGAPVRTIAAGSPGVYLVRDDGTVTLQRDKECQPVEVPFQVTSLAAADADLAAIDQHGQSWRRIGPRWQRLPRPRVFRPDQFPTRTRVTQVALTSSVLWALTEGGLVFMLSDPT